jgi:hypothetical protein
VPVNSRAGGQWEGLSFPHAPDLGDHFSLSFQDLPAILDARVFYQHTESVRSKTSHDAATRILFLY